MIGSACCSASPCLFWASLASLCIVIATFAWRVDFSKGIEQSHANSAQ
jgi:hypothetical protein